MGQMKWMATMGASDLAGVEGGAVSRSSRDRPVRRSPSSAGSRRGGLLWEAELQTSGSLPAAPGRKRHVWAGDREGNSL